MGIGRFEGRVALITGGSSGIGLAAAQAIEREGGRVIINGHDEASVDAGLRQLGPHAVGIAGRVERMADLDNIISVARERFGSLDVLVLSAGVMRVTPLDGITEKEFDETFGVNVKGVVFAVQKAAPLMKDGGSIVLIASGTTGMGRVGRTLYAASKAAVRSLARSLAAELVHRNIRVNAVSPGPVFTPLNMAPDRSEEEQRAVLGSMVPIGRVGEPDDIADAILFLASDESRFVLGADLAVDGGWAQLHEVPKAPKKPN